MAPFALSIVWFVLAFLAIPASWIALVPFARAANVYWAPIVYGTAVTVMEVMFCLGMIWKMNPFAMPVAFCRAQAIVIAVCAHALTGVCTCLAWATYTRVSRPLYYDFDRGHLAWRTGYLIPTVIFPLLASGAFIGVVIPLDAVQPTQDMHCDTVSPLWPRVLSYAGTPLLLAVPSFVLSTLTARHLVKMDTHSRRFSIARRNLRSDNLTPIPLTSKARRLFTHPHKPGQQPPSLSIITSPLSEKHNGLASPTLPSNEMYLPTSPPIDAIQPSLTFSRPVPPSPIPSFHTDQSGSETPSPITFAPVVLPNNTRRPITPLEPISPTYLPSFDPGALDFAPKAVSPEGVPSSPTRERVFFDRDEVQRGFHLPRRASTDLTSEDDNLPPRPSLELSPEYAFAKARELESQAQVPFPAHTQQVVGVTLYPPGSSLHSLRWAPQHEGLIEEEEDEVATTLESLTFAHGRQGGNNESPMALRIDTKAALEVPLPSTSGAETHISPSSVRSRLSTLLSSDMASALWHVVIFQICFILIVILAGLSTWINLARGKGPSAFGSQHVALILVGWGPLIVFGHTEAVRSHIRSFCNLRRR